MWPPLIIVDESSIEVGLQLRDCPIDLFAEGYPVELVQHGAVEALANAVGLRALGLGAAVVDILDREVEPVLKSAGLHLRRRLRLSHDRGPAQSLLPARVRMVHSNRRPRRVDRPRGW